MSVFPSTSRVVDLAFKQGDLKPSLYHVAEDRRTRTAIPANTQRSSSLRYAVNLTGATGATFVFRRRTAAASTAVSAAAVIVKAETGELRYDWQAGDTDTPGEYYGEFVVAFPDGNRTFPMEDYIEFEIVKDLNT